MKTATTLPDRGESISTGFKTARYRLVLSDRKTEWFPRQDLTTMVKKHEGRIITIETEYD